MKKLIFTAAAMMIVSTSAFAGNCELTVTRDACPGKETEALKPYEGKKETQEKKDVADEAACKAFATKTAKIVRKGTLASKKVTALFDGKAVTGDFADTKACK